MSSGEAGCLDCGHVFDAGEIAAMTACEDDEDLCTIDCTACGAHNIVRVAPQSGFEEQPVIHVLRTVDRKPASAEVFDETVEPGVDVHPTTRGESN